MSPSSSEAGVVIRACSDRGQLPVMRTFANAPPAVQEYDPRVTLVDAPMRNALAELDDYLAGVPEEQAAELVLPLGSRWVLPEAGFDLDRLRDEAETMKRATPLSDRIVSGYGDHLAYWVGQRMLEGEGDAAAQLEAARAALRERVALVEAEGYPRVAAGLRRVLDESSGGVPPDDRLWSAMALRIAESVLP